MHTSCLARCSVASKAALTHGAWLLQMWQQRLLPPPPPTTTRHSLKHEHVPPFNAIKRWLVILTGCLHLLKCVHATAISLYGTETPYDFFSPFLFSCLRLPVSLVLGIIGAINSGGCPLHHMCFQIKCGKGSVARPRADWEMTQIEACFLPPKAPPSLPDFPSDTRHPDVPTPLPVPCQHLNNNARERLPMVAAP